MNTNVKTFIENNVDMIEDDLVEFFIQASYILRTHELSILSDILQSAGIDARSAQYKLLETLVKTYIEDNLNAPSYAKDISNSWARIDYMLEETGTVGLSQQDAKQYIIDHESDMGVSCRKLSPEYGWYGSGDYAFQWFDEKAFDEEYT